VKWVTDKAPGLLPFQIKNRDTLVALRAREGYEPLDSYKIPGISGGRPHPLFSYERISPSTRSLALSEIASCFRWVPDPR
jgi:hypothetical protein